MPGASPWSPLIELFKMGCIPIGYANDEFCVYIPPVKKKGKP